MTVANLNISPLRQILPRVITEERQDSLTTNGFLAFLTEPHASLTVPKLTNCEIYPIKEGSHSQRFSINEKTIS